MAVILITGSSTGIGQEAAVQLAHAGHSVYASCRNPSGAEELQQRVQAEELSLQIVPLDLLDSDSIDQCIGNILQSEGRIDVLVSNAGVGGGRARLEALPYATTTIENAGRL